MKLFEKVKNMFTEEVEDEVKVEQVPTKVKKENVPDVIASFEDVKIEKEEVNPLDPLKIGNNISHSLTKDLRRMENLSIKKNSVTKKTDFFITEKTFYYE